MKIKSFKNINGWRWIGFALAMISVILWAQNQTSLFDSIIPTLPWGIVSLVDLYSGFILIAIWMIY